MGELLTNQVEQFIPFGQAVVRGLPEYLKAIELEHLMGAGDTHMLTLMRSGLSGTRHGDQSVDAQKYFVPNYGTLTQVKYLQDSGLWTTAPNLTYPDPESIDDSKPLGLLIPNIDGEVVVLDEGEENAHTSVVVDATIDGAIRRIRTLKETLVAGARPSRIVAISGMRRVRPDEGNSGRWEQYALFAEPHDIELPEDAHPAQKVFPTNYHSMNAILKRELEGLKLVRVIEDDGPDADLRAHETARVYAYSDPISGNDIEVIVMNGMPKVQPNAVNRERNVAEPSAPDTFQEYLEKFDIQPGGISYLSSYPHRNRIAIEGLMRLIDLSMADEVRIYPQGKMTWPDKVTGGMMAGEVEPMMRLTRGLLDKAGIPQDIIPRTGPIIAEYLRTR